MPKFNKQFLIVLGVVLSMLCTIINGLDMSFNVYALAMKETFNFTQTQVEIISSLGIFGMGLGFVEMVFFAKFGYTATFVLCAITMPLSSGILSLAAFYNQFFKNVPIVLYIVHFTMTFGNMMCQMIIARVLFSVCSPDQIAKLVAMTTSMMCFGKVVFAGLMDFIFVDNLWQFFLTLSLASFIFFTTCFPVLHRIQMSMEDFGKESMQSPEPLFDGRILSSNSDESWETQSDKSPLNQHSKLLIPKQASKTYQAAFNDDNKSDGTEMTSRRMLQTSFFHLVFWPCLIFNSGTFTLMNNITAIAQSVALKSPLNTVYLISPVIITSRIIVGVALDIFPSASSGFILLLFFDIVFATAIMIGMFWLNTTSVYIIAVLDGIALASGYNVCTPMLLNRFGKHQFNFVSSLFSCGASVCSTSYQLLLGHLYDSAVEKDQGMFCFGIHCFYRIFNIFLVVTALIFMVHGANFMFMTCAKRYDTE